MKSVVVTKKRFNSLAAAGMVALALTGCGGGGGATGGNTTPPPPPISSGSCVTLTVSAAAPALAVNNATVSKANLEAAPSFLKTSNAEKSSDFAQRCDPANPLAPAANKTGSLTIEKQWIRDYFDEAYLWYNEVPVVDPNSASFVLPASQLDGRGLPASLSNYFQALKTPAVTGSGARRDQFSFTYSTTEWNNLSQSGVTFGYGIEWAAIATAPPRKFIVAFTEPSSPAGAANVLRGGELIAVDGADFVSGNDVATLNAGLFPRAVGETHAFTIRDTSGTTRTVSLVSANVTKTPVPVAKACNTGGSNVGYLLFNDHIATSEAQLISAVNQLKAANITDLVLDLRYNGGGYLYIASELAYMIAGAGPTNGKNFETTQYNDKRSAENRASPFYNTSCILNASFQCTSQQPLPTLNLSKVYMIVSGDTCSASEAIINGLRGVDVDVRLIGSTTCGKPYGFTAKDNCGISYFPIEFKGVNAKGFGDYSDGFIPGAGALPTNVAGCRAADDYTKQLGDPAEGMFATALSYRSSGACPAAASGVKGKTGFEIGSEPSVLIRPPVRENRIYLPRS